MLVFLNEIRKVYGVVENYLTNEAGLTREDLDALKKVLLVPA
jgi:CRISPR/Cas system type I-B associated protein Csh2 (Cas7 group RAMP superfamily)